jgi:hypothetical protein
VTGVFRIRLLLDFLAVALIIACLAYWWLDNLWHEIFGTMLFALVIGHNVFNRRWYGNIPKGKRDALRVFNIVTIICLALAMLVMLATSLLISRDLFQFLAFDGAFAVREIHMFAGYWTLLIVAVHLGTRWSIVMNTIRSTLRLVSPSASRAAVFRLAALAVAVWGVKSSVDMAFGAKLMLTYTLDLWDFNESTFQFFVNYGSIIGLCAIVTHYGLILIRRVAR